MKIRGLALLVISTLSLYPATPDASGWDRPRVFHQEFDPAFAAKVRIEPAALTDRPTGAFVSPNEVFWIAPDAGSDGTVDRWTISAQDRAFRLEVSDRYSNFPAEMRWVSEKLIFLRVYWGRTTGSDYIIDCESGKILHREMVHDGTLLFNQTKETIRKEK